MNGATAVAVQGNYAYVCAYTSNSLVVIDISDPTNPTSVGSIAGTTELLNGALAVAVQGNYAYVCGHTSDSLVVIELNQYSQALAEIGGLLVNNLVCRGHSELEHVDVKNNAGVGGNFLVKGKISTSGDTIAIRTTKTPSAANDTGKKGEICWDATYVYFCVADDTWERTEHISW